jgi:peptidoglycan/LPS O-acetylase OafA/YrhL
VAVVVAYHLGALPGGFVGVDMFFVLSGYLITGLLLADLPDGRQRLLRWWGARVRRLTPAVAVLVTAILVAFATRSGITLDAFATLTWWQNWHLIAQGTDYWAASPSPLRHAWSLSIEEQFYLVWPVVTVGLVVIAGSAVRARRLVAVTALVGAGASFTWAGHLARAAQPDLSRIYFGTDTRAGALLLGCAAAAWAVGPTRAALGRAARLLLVPAVATLAVIAATGTPEHRSTYTVVLPLASLAALAVVMAATDRGPIVRPLSWAPLQWIGERSYAIYLWSWPVQVLCEDRRPDWPPALVALVTIGVSVPLAAASMRLVETPLRRGVDWARSPAVRRVAWGAGAVALLAAGTFAARSTVVSERELLAEEFEQLPDPVAAATPAAGPGEPGVDVPPATCDATATTTDVPEFAGDGSAYDPSTVTAGADPAAPSSTSAAPCGPPRRVLVVGDSTGRGAANGLKRLGRPDLAVWDRTRLGCGLVADDVECGDWHRDWAAAVAEIRPDVVLVHLGVSDDVVTGADPPFLGGAAGDARRAAMVRAAQVLGSAGARVVWTAPPVPLETGRFFCGGSRLDSPCDPAWVDAWRRDLDAAAGATGTTTLDVGAWIRARGDAPVDRPDGLHLSGSALDDQARWIAAQLP